MDTSHAHEDVFGYQVITDNGRIYEDLGSIVYTSDREKRDYFASAQSHSVPLHMRSMVKRLDTFTTSASAIGKTVISDTTIIVQAEWDGIIHIRQFELAPDRITINDYSNEVFEIVELQNKYYSLGYGQLYKR